MKKYNIEIKVSANVTIEVDDNFSLDESKTKEKLYDLLYENGPNSNGVDENGKNFTIGEILEMNIDEVGYAEEIKEKHG